MKGLKIQRMVVCMKQESSKNTTEVFAKTIFHYVPEILTPRHINIKQIQIKIQIRFDKSLMIY